MLSAATFVHAIAGDQCPSAEEARELVYDAHVAEVDPLRLLAHRYGFSEEAVYERAAAISGFAFSPVVPQVAIVNEPPANIEAIRSARTMRTTLLDREVMFAAPDCGGFLSLAGLPREHPSRRRTCIVPRRALCRHLTNAASEALLDNARQNLARRWPKASAHLELSALTRWLFVSGLLFAVFAAVLAPMAFQPVLLPVLALLLLPPSWFRLVAALDDAQPTDTPAGDRLPDDALPAYTILIPLHEEAQMVPQLKRAMEALDYPPEKLDIKFVVEASCPSTVAAAETALGNPMFDLVVVPDAQPRTKPKALNYALPLARGDLVVVFDAEDVPEPGQLRSVAELFAREPALDCVQAELVAENIWESWLTTMFSAEYSGLFGRVLPLISAWHLPMPLGGTSNHFRMEVLRAAGGWDAFNVTEDADLGVRLTRLGYRTGVVRSRTLEEAPVTLGAWLRQRTRWMKGWMQTFVVHNRHIGQFRREMGWGNFIAFQVYVGGLIFSAPLHTVYLLSLILHTALGAGGLVTDGPWAPAHLFILTCGYCGPLALTAVGLVRLGRARMLGHLALVPLYWALIGVAALLAARELLLRPFYWAKTRHGKTRQMRRLGPVARRPLPPR